MINEIKDKAEFKKLCQKAWDKNSVLWINNRVLPIKLKTFLIDFLFEKENPFILDIGCGNGWLLQELVTTKSEIKFNYVGVDINHNFIDFLKDKWFDFKYDFFVADIEKNISDIPDDVVDKAIAVLSFIEMPDLNEAFKNVYDKLEKNGTFMIVVLNPYLEMIRLNSEIDELKLDINNFRKGELFYYEKNIIANNVKSEQKYYGILHSIEKYIEIAKYSGLQLVAFNEIDGIDELGIKSTIYTCIKFIKI